jgi:hypothetical protein
MPECPICIDNFTATGKRIPLKNQRFIKFSLHGHKVIIISDFNKLKNLNINIIQLFTNNAYHRKRF